MSSEKTVDSGRGHGRQAASSSNTASSKPLGLPRTILPAWKHARNVPDSSVGKLTSMTEMRNGITATISRFPDNGTRKSAIEQLQKFDNTVYSERQVRKNEAEMAELCIGAFENTPPGAGRSGRDYLELFIQVFRGAPKKMTVGELEEIFAASMASAKVYRMAKRREQKDHASSHEAVPNIASREDSKQTQARRPIKTNHTATTPDQPLKDTTNLKPKPTAQIIAKAAPAKQNTKPAPSVYKVQPNKIRTVSKKTYHTQKEVPLMKTTEPILVERNLSEDLFSDLKENDPIHLDEEDLFGVLEENDPIHINEEQDKTMVVDPTEGARCVSERRNTLQHAEKDEVPTSEAELQDLRTESHEYNDEHSATHLKECSPADATKVAKPDGDVDSEDATASTSSRCPAETPTPSETHPCRRPRPRPSSHPRLTPSRVLRNRLMLGRIPSTRTSCRDALYTPVESQTGMLRKGQGTLEKGFGEIWSTGYDKSARVHRGGEWLCRLSTDQENGTILDFEFFCCNAPS